MILCHFSNFISFMGLLLPLVAVIDAAAAKRDFLAFEYFIKRFISAFVELISFSFYTYITVVR